MSYELEKILGVYSSQVSMRKNEQWWGYELNDLKINSNKLIHIDDLSENILDDSSVKFKAFEDF